MNVKRATKPNRRDTEDRPQLAGVAVREDDIEPVKGIRAVARLFRGMAILLVLLMIVQVVSGLTDTVPISLGVLFANAVRLLIFAGLLWGAGDLAVLWIKSHYDLRASRILLSRMSHLMNEFMATSNGSSRPQGDGTRPSGGA
jgi:hypothetical protein